MLDPNNLNLNNSDQSKQLRSNLNNSEPNKNYLDQNKLFRSKYRKIPQKKIQ